MSAKRCKRPKTSNNYGGSIDLRTRCVRRRPQQRRGIGGCARAFAEGVDQAGFSLTTETRGVRRAPDSASHFARESREEFARHCGRNAPNNLHPCSRWRDLAVAMRRTSACDARWSVRPPDVLNKCNTSASEECVGGRARREPAVTSVAMTVLVPRNEDASQSSGLHFSSDVSSHPREHHPCPANQQCLRAIVRLSVRIER